MMISKWCILFFLLLAARGASAWTTGVGRGASSAFPPSSSSSIRAPPPGAARLGPPLAFAEDARHHPLFSSSTTTRLHGSKQVAAQAVVETARRGAPSWPPSKTTVIAWVLATLLMREWWIKTPVWLQKLLLRPLKRLIVSPLRKLTRRIVTTTRGNSDPATTTSESAERREQAQKKVQFFSDSSDEDDSDTVVGKLSAIMALAQSTTDSVAKFEGFRMQGALLASLKMVQDSKKTTAELWDKFYESSGKPLFVSDATTEIDADLEVVVPEGEDVAASPPSTSNTIKVDDSPEARKELLEKWIDLLHLADWAYLEETNEIRSKLTELAANNTEYKWSLVRHVKTDEPGRVGHYLALDTESKTALISVKGTSALSDMITDACGVPVRFNVTTENGDGLFTNTTSTVSCHEGILDASLALAEDVQPLVENLFLPAGYRVLLIGHSLGMSLVYSSRFFYVPSILSVVLTL